MTPRATALTTAARQYLANESIGDIRLDAARMVTRDLLAEHALELGFAADEVRSAVENAIRAASREAITV